jgi:hypothetical protein
MPLRAFGINSWLEKLGLINNPTHLNILHSSKNFLTATCKSLSNVNSAGLIFSMDRALQLHALLTSYRHNVKNLSPLSVIFKTSTPDHHQAYLELFNEFSDIISAVIHQNQTSESLLDLVKGWAELEKAETIFFLVDDILFIEPFDMLQFSQWATHYTIPSLRMGKNINFCLMSQSPQNLPNLQIIDKGDSRPTDDLLFWQWSFAESDWGYPLSLDGHFFQREEILTLLRFIDFKTPNQFELCLQQMNPFFKPKFGICFNKSRIVNIPMNRVQNEFENQHLGYHQDELLGMWIKGLRIDAKSYYGFNNKGPHEEMPLKIQK